MVDKDLAIRNTHSTVTTISHSSPLKAWDEKGNTVVLNQSLISAEVTRLQAVYDSQEYARKRKAKYNALNQLELISDDAINGTTTHKDAILAIKSEFPKP